MRIISRSSVVASLPVIRPLSFQVPLDARLPEVPPSAGGSIKVQPRIAPQATSFERPKCARAGAIWTGQTRPPAGLNAWEGQIGTGRRLDPSGGWGVRAQIRTQAGRWPGSDERVPADLYAGLDRGAGAAGEA